MIYCGYQGVGKSTYCRNHVETAVDLDSSAFTKEEGWETNYIKKALALSAKGFKVFISAHEEVINYLVKKGIEFTLLLPADSKEVWRKRLEYRYAKLPTQGNMNAILDFEKNYDANMRFYESITAPTCKKKRIHTRIVTDLEKVLDND